MRSQTLFALLWCWAAAGCAQQPTVWTFEERDRIGNNVVTVSGAPTLVDERGGRSLCFNGEPDATLLDVNPIAGWSNFTIEVLIKPRTAGTAEQRFLHIEDARASRVLLELRMVTPQEMGARYIPVRFAAKSPHAARSGEAALGRRVALGGADIRRHDDDALRGRNA